MQVMEWANRKLEEMSRKLFNVHDRRTELKTAPPDEVRDASHDLANATMQAEGSNKMVHARLDALLALMEEMQDRN